MNWLQDESNRALVYRACLALIPLLVAIDLLTGDVANEILRAVEILLGVTASGLASKNTTRKV